MTTTPAPVRKRNQGTRAALASFLGATLEYYDLYIYASAAALIFDRVFFAAAGDGAVLLSLATFGLAYVARPLGAVLLGHVGDRFGRRRALVGSLLLMGAATFVIGCLPTYAAVGNLAPWLLVACRFLQGISVGGEAAGATALTLEHAPPGRRAFFTSWTVNGILAGFILASLVFIPISNMPEDALMTWGWRIPFWSSLLIAVVAFAIRRTLVEPEVFTEATTEPVRKPRIPVAELLSTHRGDVVRVALCALWVVASSTIPVWGLSYATRTVGIGTDTMLWVVIFGYAAGLVFQPLFARLSDRVGRRPVFIAGNLGVALTCLLYFDALARADIPMVYLGIFLSLSVFYSAANATYPAFFAEMFGVRVRFSGMAIGIQVGLVLSGFAPALVGYWVAESGGSWAPAAWLTITTALVASAAAFTARETHRTPLRDLGRREPKPAVPDSAAPEPVDSVPSR
ncbi:MFS transporter [Actinophytocola oryzae]|uniref:Putative MFS family arabinose efflux permease n=1 Tax=Actinophytocola oryzae TaxID=502181 RepID=A0A4R7VWE8_9PSEU|nr:MFS transporter [Actinophytocola oryzae]TDV54222.1 putative MFS family arabinose efflux permease [Actinophytocola oryzae]